MASVQVTDEGKVKLISGGEKVQIAAITCPSIPRSCDVSISIGGTCSTGISFTGEGSWSFDFGFVFEFFFCESCHAEGLNPIYERTCPGAMGGPFTTTGSVSVCLDYLTQEGDRFHLTDGEDPHETDPKGTYAFILDAPLSLLLGFSSALGDCSGCDGSPTDEDEAAGFTNAWHQHIEVIPHGTTLPAEFSYSYTVDGVTLTYNITLS